MLQTWLPVEKRLLWTMKMSVLLTSCLWRVGDWWGRYYRKWAAFWSCQTFSPREKKPTEVWLWPRCSFPSLWSLNLFISHSYPLDYPRCPSLLPSSVCVSATGEHLRLCLRPAWRPRQPSPTWDQPSAASLRMSGESLQKPPVMKPGLAWFPQAAVCYSFARWHTSVVSSVYVAQFRCCTTHMHTQYFREWGRKMRLNWFITFIDFFSFYNTFCLE